MRRSRRSPFSLSERPLGPATDGFLKVFNPSAADTVTLNFAATSARYVRLSITANTGWPAAQCSEFEVYGTTSNPPTDGQPPTAPGNLTVTGKTANSVSLSWQPSTDNVAVTGYQVRQGSTVVATLTGTTHTVTGLNPNTSYSFTVTAQDAADLLAYLETLTSDK